jgi:hypothetical protein
MNPHLILAPIPTEPTVCASLLAQPFTLSLFLEWNWPSDGSTFGVGREALPIMFTLFYFYSSL